MKSKYAELLTLDIDEKWEILDALWNSISETTDEIALPNGLEDELERRRIHFQKHPESVMTWEQVKASIVGSHG